MDYIEKIALSFLGMVWELYWGLSLGFMLSSLIRAFVPTSTISQSIGKTTLKSISLSTFFGAISSSCSYAAASMARTLFMKGASLSNATAFLISSTNLVFEIFIILVSLLGWSFFAGELVGGLFFITLTGILITKLFPKKIIEKAKAHVKAPVQGNHVAHSHHHMGHEHGSMNIEKKASSYKDKIKEASSYFSMDVQMVGKDILIGVSIASILMVIVPKSFWQVLFLNESSELPQFVILLWNAIIGALLAVVSFVCSVGNIVLASVLWYGGISFGGVISFLLSDLITLPMLQVYKKYFGLKPMLYLFLFLFIGIIATALFLDYSFEYLNWLPEHPKGKLKMNMNQFEWNYKTILNFIFIPLSIAYFMLGKKNSKSMKM